MDCPLCYEDLPATNVWLLPCCLARVCAGCASDIAADFVAAAVTCVVCAQPMTTAPVVADRGEEAGAAAVFCSVHPTELVEVYCTPCDALACRRCYVDGHGADGCGTRKLARMHTADTLALEIDALAKQLTHEAHLSLHDRKTEIVKRHEQISQQITRVCAQNLDAERQREALVDEMEALLDHWKPWKPLLHALGQWSQNGIPDQDADKLAMVLKQLQFWRDTLKVEGEKLVRLSERLEECTLLSAMVASRDSTFYDRQYRVKALLVRTNRLFGAKTLPVREQVLAERRRKEQTARDDVKAQVELLQQRLPPGSMLKLFTPPSTPMPAGPRDEWSARERTHRMRFAVPLIEACSVLLNAAGASDADQASELHGRGGRSAADERGENVQAALDILIRDLERAAADLRFHDQSSVHGQLGQLLGKFTDAFGARLAPPLPSHVCDLRSNILCWNVDAIRFENVLLRFAIDGTSSVTAIDATKLRDKPPAFAIIDCLRQFIFHRRTKILEKRAEDTRLVDEALAADKKAVQAGEERAALIIDTIGRIRAELVAAQVAAAASAAAAEEGSPSSPAAARSAAALLVTAVALHRRLTSLRRDREDIVGIEPARLADAQLWHYQFSPYLFRPL